MINVAGSIVLLSGLYLIGLGAVSIVAPTATLRFLLAFASSAPVHVLEMFLRVLAGVAFITYAPRMMFGDLFRIFGWLLVATSLVLLAMPWRWHRRFASWAVPVATRRLPLFAFISITLGAFLLLSMLTGKGN